MTDNVRTNVLAAFCRLCEGIDTQSGQTHRFVPTPIRRGGPVCPPDYYILRNGQTRRCCPYAVQFVRADLCVRPI